jgi:hypothetical protein
MSDIFEQLKRIEEQACNSKIYVYYNQHTGEIIHLRNQILLDQYDDYPFIEVEKTEIYSDFDSSKYLVIDRKTHPKLIKKLFLDTILI